MTFTRGTMLTMTAAALALAALPVTIRPADDRPGLTLAPATALARRGADDGPGDDSGRDRDRDDRVEPGDDRDRDRDRGRDRRDDRGDDRSGRRHGGEDRRDGRRDDRRGGIEVTLPSGERIEIRNGRFERKDRFGRTVEERPARPGDFEAWLR